MAHARKDHRRAAEKPASPFSSLSPLTLDLLSVGLLYAVTLIVFRGIIFDNAAFASQGDTAAAFSYTHAGNEIEKAEGVDAVWMPYFFSGMPTFGNVAYLPHNVSYVQTVLQTVLNLLYLNGTWTWLVVYCFMGGVFMFFLMRVWNFSRPAALLAAVTFMLSPYMVGLAGEGHGSKLMALSYVPLVVLLTHSLLERRDALSLGLLAAAIGTLMLTNHMQIVYYAFMFLGLYLVYHIMPDFQGNIPKAALKVALFAGAIILGFCISSYIYLSVYDYAQFSMRGGGTAGAPGGLAYDYATNWSWHPGELITLLIPGFFGMKSDFYWGPMIPWTNSSVYVGLFPILFGTLAFVYRRTRFVMFFGVVTILIILVSFGSNFSLLYQLLFTWLPFFNKFRAPEQILHLLPFATGVLGATGFSALLAARERESGVEAQKLYRVLLAAGGVIAGLLIVALLFQSSLLDSLPASMFTKQDQAEQIQQQYGARAGRVIAQLRQARFDIFWKDYVKFSLLAAALCALCCAWLKGRLREVTFSAALLVLVTIDLTLVASRYIDPKPSQELAQAFRPDPTTTFLKSQPGLFRLFAGIDPRDPLYMDNAFAYHGLQSITGYSPAKLKIYQTLLDSCMYRGTDPSFPVNMNVVDMLNVQFLVVHGRLPEPQFQLVNVDQAERVLTYRNPAALPRAFYAGESVTAAGDDEVFRILNSRGFDPARTAVLYKRLPGDIVPADSTHVPRITSYKSREIRIATDVPAPALLVLSEVYYPSGWKAFIDGTETEIFRTDYILRSVLVPGGTHEVVFTFDPPMYRAGWVLTHAAWGVALICAAAGFWRRQTLKRRATPPGTDRPSGGSAAA
jgi:hypothetical protein